MKGHVGQPCAVGYAALCKPTCVAKTDVLSWCSFAFGCLCMYDPMADRRMQEEIPMIDPSNLQLFDELLTNPAVSSRRLELWGQVRIARLCALANTLLDAALSIAPVPPWHAPVRAHVRRCCLHIVLAAGSYSKRLPLC